MFLVMCYYILVAEIYFFSAFWCDLIRYIYSKKKRITYNYLGLNQRNQINIITKNDCDENEDIFKCCDNGLPEVTINNRAEGYFICNVCNFISNDFMVFIHNFNELMNNNNNNDITTVTVGQMITNQSGQNMINTQPDLELNKCKVILNCDGYNYKFTCKPSDKFSVVVNKFYNKCPNYINKDCYFMVDFTRKIEENKTLIENNINNNQIINVLYNVN